MMYTKIRSLISGPDRKKSFQTFFLAIGLFVCSTAVFATVPRFSEPFATPTHQLFYTVVMFLWWEYFALGLVVGSMILAIRDRGLRRVWIFVFACGAGVGINLGGIGITGDMPGLLFRVLWAGVIGVATATVLGLLGWSLGLAFRRLSSM